MDDRLEIRGRRRLDIVVFLWAMALLLLAYEAYAGILDSAGSMIFGILECPPRTGGGAHLLGGRSSSCHQVERWPAARSRAAELSRLGDGMD